jgi:hypothetical protein
MHHQTFYDVSKTGILDMYYTGDGTRANCSVGGYNILNNKDIRHRIALRNQQGKVAATQHNLCH